MIRYNIIHDPSEVQPTHLSPARCGNQDQEGDEVPGHLVRLNAELQAPFPDGSGKGRPGSWIPESPDEKPRRTERSQKKDHDEHRFVDSSIWCPSMGRLNEDTLPKKRDGKDPTKSCAEVC